MDMFGGLTKTSSRIAIAAALGMTLGGFAMSASPAKAADLGGDCCADLEERVAELEATTVRKGNKKVSVTLSGWVVKSLNWWDDGEESKMYVGDKDYTLSSHFQISGSATIAPGWSGGYTMSIEAPGNAFGFFSNQFNDNTNFWSTVDGLTGDVNLDVLLSYMWIKSDKYGTLNWGTLSQATDNVALLPDLSGTIIESNAVMFEGPGFFLRPSNGVKNAVAGTTAATWGSFLFCNSVLGGIGADCFGAPTNAVRYDSPTFGGFSVSTSYGEDSFWDIAAKYAADWNSVKFSAAFGYTDTHDEAFIVSSLAPLGFKEDNKIYQVGASALHVPTGLFIYGLYQEEHIEGTNKPIGVNSDAGASKVWYIKGGIKRTWSPLGATVLFGEYAQYQDQFSDLQGNQCGNLTTLAGTTNVDAACAAFGNVFVTGSEVKRWGVGVVQEIDSAAMHLWARWQHLDLDTDLVTFTTPTTGFGVNQSWENWDLFQVGGVIFF
jgi:hypothetical protein